MIFSNYPQYFNFSPTFSKAFDQLSEVNFDGFSIYIYIYIMNLLMYNMTVGYMFRNKLATN